jgi:hypothetical protein
MWSRVGDIVREVAEKSKLGVGTGEVSLVVSDLVNDYSNLFEKDVGVFEVSEGLIDSSIMWKGPRRGSVLHVTELKSTSLI